MPIEPITAPAYGTYRWFCRAIGMYLGLDPNWHLWDAAQDQQVNQLVQSGLRNFYHPALVDLKLTPHTWSFMRPVFEIKTDADQRVYPLPSNFDRFDGDLTFGNEEHYPNIQIVNEQKLRSLEYHDEWTAPPQFAAVRPVVSDGRLTQVQEMVLHPTPDSTYIIKGSYFAIPIELSDDQPYPMGQEVYSEAIKASCLAAAELEVKREQGPMALTAREQIASAIARDLRRGPDLLGYNADASTISLGRLHQDVKTVRDFLYTDVSYTGSS